MENNYTVYAHKFPNGKYYIGLTRQKPYRRWNNGLGYKFQPVYDAIKKYGWDNIEHIIVKENLSQEEGMKLEQELIKKYDSINNGYNIGKGGDVGKDQVKQFKYNGQILTSEQIANISNVDGITGHDITTRVNHHGWDLERAMSQKKNGEKSDI